MGKIRFSAEEQELQKRIRLEAALREASQRQENDHNQGSPRAPLSLTEKFLLGVIGVGLVSSAAIYFGPEIKEDLKKSFANNPISKVFSLTFPSN